MDERGLIVIGGGAAGFMAADRASEFGGKVTLVEKEELGGTCTNWGCIPMQFLLGNLISPGRALNPTPIKNNIAFLQIHTLTDF